MKLLIAAGFIILANILAWFQTNGQFVWESWKDNPWISVLPMAIPTGFCFCFATKYIVEETNELWAAKFMCFGISYLVFPILTWWLMNESMLTAKTLTCTFLSVIIVYIQVFWK